MENNIYSQMEHAIADFYFTDFCSQTMQTEIPLQQVKKIMMIIDLPQNTMKDIYLKHFQKV
jgi:hypothetical protein